MTAIVAPALWRDGAAGGGTASSYTFMLESSFEGGKSWTLLMQGTYRRKG